MLNIVLFHSNIILFLYLYHTVSITAALLYILLNSRVSSNPVVLIYIFLLHSPFRWILNFPKEPVYILIAVQVKSINWKLVSMQYSASPSKNIELYLLPPSVPFFKNFKIYTSCYLVFHNNWYEGTTILCLFSSFNLKRILSFNNT